TARTMMNAGHARPGEQTGRSRSTTAPRYTPTHQRAVGFGGRSVTRTRTPAATSCARAAKLVAQPRAWPVSEPETTLCLSIEPDRPVLATARKLSLNTELGTPAAGTTMAGACAFAATVDGAAWSSAATTMIAS